MARAIHKNILQIDLYNLANYSLQNTKRVDEKAYGMHGQVITPEPLANCIEEIFEKVWKKIPVIYMTPSWELLNQEKVEYFSQNLEECIIICGHYEWIDQRIIDLFVDYCVSIWEYILTSWELSAMVFLDSIVRLLPWVLGNPLSHEEESFSKKLERKKEYPLYTKPQIFRWIEVPPVLLSGNHAEIEKWKIKNIT